MVKAIFSSTVIKGFPVIVNRHIWQGIYTRFSQVQSQQDYPFDTLVWAESQIRDLNNILKSNVSVNSKYMLKTIFDLYALSNKNIKILDFGGGIGITYISDFANIDVKSLALYAIIERPELCRIGRSMLETYQNLHFSESLIEDDVDIVFCGSSFHYVDDWKKNLTAFSSLNPNIILFSDIPAGQNIQFITAQSYYNNKIPVRFFNITILSDFMTSLGYSLSYIKDMPNKYNSQLDMFDAKYRIDSFKELVFIKNLTR